MKLLILNGPNLNLLGLREPAIYGSQSYAALLEKIQAFCDKEGVEVSFFQSNHEGALVDAIQEARGRYDFIIFNAAAYTHYSIALRDAIAAVQIPVIEVHISNIPKREAFRHTSVLAPVVLGQICGLGTDSYMAALEAVIRKLAAKEEKGDAEA